jgi:hypothetical protein
MKVKEVEITFHVKGTHKQRIVVPANTDLNQLIEDLENDICHTNTTGKSVIKMDESGVEIVGDIVKQEPNTSYCKFEVREI